ncbi:hypothetical protein [Actinobacillus porcinus]|uniref:hypothetical protein n=1 Tax=Actinobacillus porcinus TaxID=51048 RepID=UPI002352A096|nr:hypothetical protein [Actinobacillus porcinus]MDY5849047.1 hypothetical protein [Actinobacillus porcinus]
MILKEKGYDEFLAENIKLGLADIEAGRTISLDDAKKEWQQLLERKALDMALLDEELEHELYA